MTEEEYDQKIGILLSKWRTDAGMTQAEMADALQISRRTVVDLEHGSAHAKNYTVHRWAEITGHHKERDIRRVIYPSSDTMPGYDNALNSVIEEIHNMYDDEVLALRDILINPHGGSRRALVHLFDAYLHTGIGERQMITSLIMNSYEAAQRMGKNKGKDFHPDIDLIRNAWEKGFEAYVNGNDKYFME